MLAVVPDAAGKGLCPRGRFELGGAVGRDAAVIGSAVLVLDEGTAALEGMCPIADANRAYFYGQWQSRIRLRVASCEPHLARGSMRLRHHPRTCETMKGTFRSGRARTKFVARRLPTCANETIEEGETCDDGNRDDGDCCSATCALEPGCSGACERTADCHPAALCARDNAVGAACSTSRGTCTPVTPASRDAMCPQPNPNDPVSGQCGCDRQHHATLCDAWAAGVAVSSFGRCPCQESTGLLCPAGYWCDLQYQWQTCDEARARAQVGECVALGRSCEGVEQTPSCGCDGVVYPSDCARQQAQVRRNTAIVCPPQ